MKKHLLLISFLLILGCSEKKTYHSPNFDLIKLSEGVFACIHKFGGKAICNVGIIDNGKETIIFDNFLSLKVAEELLTISDQMGLSPIKYVVNSHWHNDHIRGNQVFPSDVNIISTTKTAELIEEREPLEIADEKSYAPARFEYFDSLLTNYTGDSTDRAFLDTQLWRPYYETLSESHKVVKTRVPNTFVDDQQNLDGPKRKVQLITKGEGHTESDLILYLPDDQIIFTGDLVFNESHPYLAHGFPEKWKKWLAYIETLKITKVVPGHGQIGEKAIINTMQNYISSVEEVAKKMIAENIPIEEAGKIKIPAPYQTWWFDMFFVPNLQFMYEEVSKHY